jgi:hypothetical protein
VVVEMSNYSASSLVGYGYLGVEYSCELSYMTSPYYAYGLSAIGYNATTFLVKGDNITVSTDLSYVTAVGSAPITLFLLGIISILLLLFYTLFRQCYCKCCQWCCNCFKCLPRGKKRDMKKVQDMPKYKAVEMEKIRLGGEAQTGNDDSMKIDEDLLEEANYERMIVEQDSVQKQRKKMKYYLVPLLFTLLVVIQLALISNTYFDTVYEDITLTLDTLSAIISAITSKHTILYNRGILITETLIDAINSTSCNSTRLPSLLPVMNTYNANIQELDAYIGSMSEHLLSLQDYVEVSVWIALFRLTRFRLLFLYLSR